jgi:hypothetical protein
MSNEFYKTKSNYQKLKPKKRSLQLPVTLYNSPSSHITKSPHHHKSYSSFSRNHSSSTTPTIYPMTQTSNLASINNRTTTQLKPLKDYKTEVASIMEKYAYRSPHPSHFKGIESILTRTKQSFYFSKKKEISRIFSQPRLNNLETEDTKIQISKGNNSEFNGPIETLNVITRNKVIHDQLLENYQNREVQRFEKSMNEISYLETHKKIAELVKITPTMPKIMEQNLFNNNNNIKHTNNTNNINKENEINENISATNAEISNGYIDNTNNNRMSFTNKKKKIINISNNSFIKQKLYLQAKTIYSPKNFPENREQFSFSANSNGTSIYLYGGFSSNIRSNSLWRLETSNFSWSNLPSTSLQPDLRTGHTGIIYKNKFIVFGGRYAQIPILADVDVYHTDTKTWSSPALNTTRFLKLRKHHIACLIGQHMLIHGGISETGEFLNDCFLLQINPFKWIEAKVSTIYDKPTLAMHACALVLPDDIKNNIKFNIYKFPEVSSNKRVFCRIKEKGLYVFGGKSKDDHKPNNTLRVLRIGKKPLEWITLDTKGEAPSPRYMCSLNFFEEGNYLIVHGGRNDLETKSSAFNDMFICELYRLEWLRVVFNNNIKAVNRYNHGAAISGKHLIIFGGMNGNNFLGSGLFVVNLDPDNAVQNDGDGFELIGKVKGVNNDGGNNDSENNSNNYNNKIKLNENLLPVIN